MGELLCVRPMLKSTNTVRAEGRSFSPPHTLSDVKSGWMVLVPPRPGEIPFVCKETPPVLVIIDESWLDDLFLCLYVYAYM